MNVYKKEKGEQKEATKEMENAWEAAADAYMPVLQIGRKLVFKNDAKAVVSLQLSGKRKTSLSGWIGQARAFYSNLLANPDWVARMAVYSFDETKLKAGLALVDALEQANLKQENEKKPLS